MLFSLQSLSIFIICKWYRLIDISSANSLFSKFVVQSWIKCSNNSISSFTITQNGSLESHSISSSKWYCIWSIIDKQKGNAHSSYHFFTRKSGGVHIPERVIDSNYPILINSFNDTHFPIPVFQYNKDWYKDYKKKLNTVIRNYTWYCHDCCLIIGKDHSTMNPN